MPNFFKANVPDAGSLRENKQHAEFYESLKQREQQWWQARQRLILLRERQMFWFGDRSLIMWLMWQLVSYVVVAIALMLMSKLLNVPLALWQYLTIFGIQTLIFITTLAFKGKLATHIQDCIEEEDLVREQALNEMTILATDSIFPDIHANAPISLQQLHKRYEAQLRLASLQCLLQQEINAGRLLLGHQQTESQNLPPELADDELTARADKMLYSSLLQAS